MNVNYEEWRPIETIIEKSKEVIRPLIESHFKSVSHTENRQAHEIELFASSIHFITHKWNLEIIYQLEVHNGLIFNELRRHLGNISARTLSDRLQELQDRKLIQRTVMETRPPQVHYSLTKFGQGFSELALILLYYMIKAEMIPDH